MKHTLLSILVVLVLGVGFGSTRSFAEDVPVVVPSVAQLDAAFQYELNTRFENYDLPKATSYYDDQVDHYEHDQLMRDTIDRGL